MVPKGLLGEDLHQKRDAQYKREPCKLDTVAIEATSKPSERLTMVLLEIVPVFKRLTFNLTITYS